MATDPEQQVRAVLPIPDPQHAGLTTYDAKDPDSSYPPIEPLRPPAGAPNVLVVLLDDVGFGASSAFGGPCETPTAERLAGDTRWVGSAAIPAGEHQVRMEFAYDGGGLGKGGTVNLFLDGETVGEGRVEATVPVLFSADETTDIGSDSATPVRDDYGSRDGTFTGSVRWVQLDVAEAAEDEDHLISPDERLRVAMARQ
jgi:hypothetical protein